MFLWLCLQLLFGLSLFTFAIYWLFLLPPTHPKNIPAVPFWVVLIPFFRDVDQEETYRKYLEEPFQTHGAVKLYFGARWNIIVQRPSYLAEIFKDEETFHKSGNQKKIPHSVLAEFLGDNIISARGDDWKLYQDIVKPGLQANFDVQPILSNASLLCDLLEEAQASASGRGVAVQELLQRYTIANVSKCLLETDFETLSNADATLNKLQSEVKREIFKPIFLNFPFLDRFPIPSRKEARKVVARFSSELAHGLEQSHALEKCSLTSANLGRRLLAARDEGLLTPRQFRDNLNVTFVAGQENPQLLLISTLYLLGKHADVQARLREEVRTSSSTLAELPFLTAVIYEALRLFPPISQLVNRKTATATVLADEVYIPKNTYVGYNCYATNRDPAVWGADSHSFVPDRWGATNDDINRRYRRARARAEFVSFHGGKRSCLGERFALLEMRVTLSEMLKRLQWRLDEDWQDRKTPAGPLYPRALRLKFRKL